MRWLVALTAALGLLFGPAPARADEPLVVWHAYRGAEKAALEQVLAAFTRERGIAVEALQVPHDAYASKLTAAVPRGHGPHVFIDSHERLGDLEERGVVATLARTDFDASLFSELALGALGSGARVRGLPLALKCLALYVNPALVPSVPDTLEAVAALPLPAGVVPIAYEARNMYFHAAILHAFGGSQLGPNESFGFAGEPGAKSIELVRALIEKGAVPEEASGAIAGELFKTGHAATAISGPWFASDLGATFPYRVVPLPKIAATGAPMRPYLTVEAAALTPRGAESLRARELLVYLATGTGAEIRARIGRQVVALVRPPESVASDPFLVAFTEQAKSAVVMSSSPRMRATWEPAERALKKGLSATVDPRSALAEAARRFDDVVRPPPPRKSPLFFSLVLGALALTGVIELVRRTRSGAFLPAFRRSLPAYRWVAHAVVAIGLLVIFPLLVGAGTAFFAGPQGNMYFVGLSNFVEILTARGGPLLSSGSFYLVLLVTLLWTVANVTLHVAIGFALGLLLSRPGLALKPLYRVLLIIPWAVPSYVTALAWKGMFSRQFGAVSALVEALGVEPFSWWARFSTAFSANLATNVWLGFPFMMVVTMGALTGIPKDVLEAAEVDGATRWQRLWRVTLPMTLPTLLPAVLLGAIWTFNMFNVVFLVSGGEPDGSTDILISEAYRWAFTRQAQYGYAAAYAVLIFMLLTLSSRLLSRVGRTREVG
jgi:arabinogalactan oligomer/maltooligosaccharide transport system permease protein